MKLYPMDYSFVVTDVNNAIDVLLVSHYINSVCSLVEGANRNVEGYSL